MLNGVVVDVIATEQPIPVVTAVVTEVETEINRLIKIDEESLVIKIIAELRPVLIQMVKDQVRK
jgi:hypothetical protein